MSLSIIILAAGKGKRMLSDLPKVFHNVGNYPMLYHVLDTSIKLKPKNLCVVISDQIKPYTDEIKRKYKKVTFSNQKLQKGTADAVLCGLTNQPSLKSDSTLILNADTPLIEEKTLKKFIQKFKKEKTILSILSMEPKNSDNSYGKLVVEGENLKKIIEKNELSQSERNLTLCNSGVMLVKTKHLYNKIKNIKNRNSKNEFYLTDIVEIVNSDNLKVTHMKVDFNETLGVNDKQDLAYVEKIFQEKIRLSMLIKGISMIDPKTVYFSADTIIGKNVTIQPNVFFGPQVQIGNNVLIKSNCHIEESRISNYVTVGPFARLRNGSDIAEKTKIGNFVEVKKSRIKKNVKISHLSYVGDANIGNDVNIGAGSITCNYDGFKKNKTFIGSGCFIGSNTSLIAPIKIKKNSIVGAGTVVDKNVKESTLVYRKSELVKKNKKK